MVLRDASDLFRIGRPDAFRQLLRLLAGQSGSLVNLSGKALPDGATLHFWRSAGGAEVDFVLVRGDLILPVEVKAGRSGRPLPSKSLRSFLEAYRPATALMLNLTLAHRSRIGETVVEWIPPSELARRVEEVFAVE
ncbi:MAG: DUF4143 domain-containing protein [Acidobacteria bacterium]|nr:DUF4143 domain-containing protein [Acidobacteriota bacterium]